MSHRSCYGTAKDVDNYGLSLRDNHVTNRTNTEGKPVNYHAHTANDGLGKPLPEDSGQWQPLDAHLRNVAELAKQFAAPLGSSAQAEAEIAGLLHDLGKYAERFQLRLRNPAIHGINHWATAAAYAYALKNPAVAFAADGHHTGIQALNEAEAGTPLRQTIANFTDPKLRLELTGQCSEDLITLLDRFKADGLQLPQFAPRPVPRTAMACSRPAGPTTLDNDQSNETLSHPTRNLRPDRNVDAARHRLVARVLRRADVQRRERHL